MTTTQSQFFSKIEQLIFNLKIDEVTIERKAMLQPLVAFIQTKVNEQNEIRLNFICTHNSRRSHLAQVWAQTAAAHFSIKNLFCYSGGTEATALFPILVKTLENQGFKINTLCEVNNPIYAIKYAENEHPIFGFSKKYDDDFNPKDKFAAIMTCSEADVGCPFISGAEYRIPITYDDPKVYDNTPQQIEQYQKRSMQIATEMFYVFSQIK